MDRKTQSSSKLALHEKKKNQRNIVQFRVYSRWKAYKQSLYNIVNTESSISMLSSSSQFSFILNLYFYFLCCNCCQGQGKVMSSLLFRYCFKLCWVKIFNLRKKSSKMLRKKKICLAPTGHYASHYTDRARGLDFIFTLVMIPLYTYRAMSTLKLLQVRVKSELYRSQHLI